MALEDSKILIEDSKNLLKEIESLYSRDLLNGEDSPLLRVRIKQFLENINSALDYAAFSVFTEFCAERLKKEQPNKFAFKERNVYFPCKLKKGGDGGFLNYITDRFPYLEQENPIIIETFEKFQPFPAKSKWLSYLKDLVNSNKHRTLLKQVQQQTTSINRLTASNGSSIVGGTIIGDFPFKFVNEDGSEATITSFDGDIKIEFMFSNINQPVIPTLRRIIRSAPTVINDIEKCLKGA